MDTALTLAWVEQAARVVAENRDHLTNLDAAIGDSDHGINLDRGFTNVLDALRQTPPQTPGGVLLTVGGDAHQQGRRRERPPLRDGVPSCRQVLGGHRERRHAPAE